MTQLTTFMLQLTVLYGAAAAGYIAKIKGIINGESDHALTQIILYITLPALILYSMDFPYQDSLLKDFGWLILLSFYALGIACLLALFLASRSNLSPDKKSVYQGLVIFGNQGFLGYAVCSSLFSKPGIMYAALFNIFFLILIWTYGIYILTKGRVQFSWKAIILNPGIAATVAGLFMFLFSIKWPLIISGTLELLGTPTTPLSMLLIGSLIGNLDVKGMWKALKSKYIWIAVITKLIIVPLFLFPFVFLNLKFEVFAVAVLVTAMPCAPTTPIFAKKYGGNAVFGSIGVWVSSMLSLITLPVLYLLLNYFT